MKDKVIDGLIFTGMTLWTLAMMAFCLYPFYILIFRIETV